MKKRFSKEEFISILREAETGERPGNSANIAALNCAAINVDMSFNSHHFGNVLRKVQNHSLHSMIKVHANSDHN